MWVLFQGSKEELCELMNVKRKALASEFCTESCSVWAKSSPYTRTYKTLVSLPGVNKSTLQVSATLHCSAMAAVLPLEGDIVQPYYFL